MDQPLVLALLKHCAPACGALAACMPRNLPLQSVEYCRPATTHLHPVTYAPPPSPPFAPFPGLFDVVG